MAAALEIAMNECAGEQRRILAMRERLEQGIRATISEVVFHGHTVERLAGTLSIGFRFIEGESLLLSLDLAGMAVSTGSACASGSPEPSHVLKAMGIPADIARGTLRFSLGHENSEADIDHILSALPPLVERLRTISPLWESSCRKQ